MMYTVKTFQILMVVKMPRPVKMCKETFYCDSCSMGGGCKTELTYPDHVKDIVPPDSCLYGWFNIVKWEKVENHVCDTNEKETKAI